MHLRSATTLSLALVGAIALAAAGCGSDPGPQTPAIESASPAFGPLAGGYTITLTGSGFAFDNAEPNHVVIGGQEAVLASALDDSTLEVVVPAGTAAGDAQIVVFNDNGYVAATGLFRYTSAPTVDAVTPRDVLYDSVTTRVTITGAGFKDDDAGPVTVTVAGAPAVDVSVDSDTQITFTATPGIPLSLHDVTVSNRRGDATKANAIRYVPTMGKGFLMFSKNVASFAWFYDPIAKKLVRIPNSPARLPTSRPGFRALVVDAAGEYWAHTRDGLFGKIDFQTQNLVDPVPMGARVTGLVRKGSEVFAVTRSGRFGKVDLTSGAFSLVGSANVSCCGFGVSTVGQTMYVGSEAGISTIDPVTGLRGAVVPLTPSYHFADLRDLDGVLYGITRDGKLVSIDPNTGISSLIEDFGVEVSAMETFQ